MAASGAVRAGKAYVELFADDGPLQRGLKTGEKRLADWGRTVTTLGTRLAVAGAAGLSAGLAGVMRFTQAGESLARLSQETGVSVESLSELSAVAQSVGGDIGTVRTAFESLNGFMIQAAQGSAEAADTMFRLGLSFQQLESMTGPERLQTVADALARVENPAIRAQRGAQLLGSAYQQLAPALRNGAAGLDQATSRMRELGLTMTTADAEGAASLAMSMRTLWAVVQMVAVKVGAALAPALQAFVAWVIPVVASMVQWIDENRSLVIGLFAGIAAVTALGVALIVLGKILVVLSFAFGALGTVISAVVTVVGFLFSPLGLAVVVAVALAAGIVWLIFQFEACRTAVAELIPDLSAFGETFRQVWGGILDAISAGDFAGAFEVAWLGVQVVWVRFTNWIMNRLRLMKLGFLTVWDEITTEIAVFMNTAITNAITGFNGLISQLPEPVQLALRAAGVGQIANNGAASEVAIRDAHAARVAARGNEALGDNAADRARLDEVQGRLDEALGRLAENAQAAEEDRAARISHLGQDGINRFSEVARLQSVGTFSAAQASAFAFAGNSPAERTARATEIAADVLAAIRDRLNRSVLVWQ